MERLLPFNTLMLHVLFMFPFLFDSSSFSGAFFFDFWDQVCSWLSGQGKMFLLRIEFVFDNYDDVELLLRKLTLAFKLLKAALFEIGIVRVRLEMRSSSPGASDVATTRSEFVHKGLNANERSFASLQRLKHMFHQTIMCVCLCVCGFCFTGERKLKHFRFGFVGTSDERSRQKCSPLYSSFLHLSYPAAEQTNFTFLSALLASKTICRSSISHLFGPSSAPNAHFPRQCYLLMDSSIYQSQITFTSHSLLRLIKTSPGWFILPFISSRTSNVSNRTKSSHSHSGLLSSLQFSNAISSRSDPIFFRYK